MIKDQLLETIKLHLPTLKTSSSGWYTCDCPVCVYRGETPDKRQRFGIKTNVDRIGMNCFNCNFSAMWEEGKILSNNLIWFLTTIGVSEEDLRELKFLAYREQQHVNVKFAPTLNNSIKSSWPKVELPMGSKTLLDWANDGCTDDDFINVAEYALSRGITNFEDFYWTPSREFYFNKRLIIPFKYNNVIVGYTGRYYNNTHNKNIRKYMANTPDSFIYNLDQQKEDREYVILCEGSMDAYLVSGIACLSNSINEKQCDIINSLGKKIILCPDRDVAGDNTIKTAIDNGWYVSFPKWERDVKDPAQAVQKYGKLFTVKTIIDSIVNNPLKIHVSRKFDTFKI